MLSVVDSLVISPSSPPPQSSFPDHNEKGESTLTFSWRIPRLRPKLPTSGQSRQFSLPSSMLLEGRARAAGTGLRGNEKTAAEEQTGARSETHLCGYCYFLQERNKNIRRGFAQRSLVIITRQQHLSGLFTRLADILGPMYFATQWGESATVETAVHNICRWYVSDCGISLFAPDHKRGGIEGIWALALSKRSSAIHVLGRLPPQERLRSLSLVTS